MGRVQTRHHTPAPSIAATRAIDASTGLCCPTPTSSLASKYSGSAPELTHEPRAARSKNRSSRLCATSAASTRLLDMYMLAMGLVLAVVERDLKFGPSQHSFGAFQARE